MPRSPLDRSPQDPFSGVVVNDETGEIVEEVATTYEMSQHVAVEPFHYLVEGKYDANTQYFDNGVLSTRPIAISELEHAIPADGVTELVLDVPVGTGFIWMQEIEGEHGRRRRSATVEDGTFEFSSNIPGEYEFQVRPPFPYQRQVIKVVVE